MTKFQILEGSMGVEDGILVCIMHPRGSMATPRAVKVAVKDLLAQYEDPEAQTIEQALSHQMEQIDLGKPTPMELIQI